MCHWQYQSCAEYGLLAKAQEIGHITQSLNILSKFPQTHSHRYIGVSEGRFIRHEFIS